MNSYRAVASAFDKHNMPSNFVGSYTRGNSELRFGGRYCIAAITKVQFNMQLEEETIHLRFDNRGCCTTNCTYDCNMKSPYCDTCDTQDNVVNNWATIFPASNDVLKGVYDSIDYIPEYYFLLDTVIDELFKLRQECNIVVTFSGFLNIGFKIHLGDNPDNRTGTLSCTGCGKPRLCCGYKLKNLA